MARTSGIGRSGLAALGPGAWAVSLRWRTGSRLRSARGRASSTEAGSAELAFGGSSLSLSTSGTNWARSEGGDAAGGGPAAALLSRGLLSAGTAPAGRKADGRSRPGNRQRGSRRGLPRAGSGPNRAPETASVRSAVSVASTRRIGSPAMSGEGPGAEVSRIPGGARTDQALGSRPIDLHGSRVGRDRSNADLPDVRLRGTIS